MVRDAVCPCRRSNVTVHRPLLSHTGVKLCAVPATVRPMVLAMTSSAGLVSVTVKRKSRFVSPIRPATVLVTSSVPAA